MRHRSVACVGVALIAVGVLVLALAAQSPALGSLEMVHPSEEVHLPPSPPPAQPPPPTQPPPPAPGPNVTGFEERGHVSYYRYGDPTFWGGCVVIRDATNWSGFWAVHKDGVWPFPPTPGIDFDKEIVLVCILGYVNHCCQSHVNFTAIERTADGYSVTVDMYRHYPDPDDIVLWMITNPYHIKAAPRVEGLVTFSMYPWGGPIPEIPPIP